MSAIGILNWALRRGLLTLCCALLAAMVAFTTYSVVMRSVFLAPPFWGDTLTLFANIWLVMFAFAIIVRDDANIAVESLYVFLPARAVRGVKIFWLTLFAAVGAILAVFGYEAADRILGRYWELGNMPKSYPMMILPISGVLILVAAILAIRDALRNDADPNDNDDKGKETTCERDGSRP